MADLLDELLQGVPNVSNGRSAPSVFGPNAVSFEQANRITADRVNTQSQLLETRSRFNQLRREEKTRRDGQNALAELSQLDPANDPKYMGQVQDILARHPNASLDAAVSNFLEVQGGIFEDAEADRDAEEEVLRRRRENKRTFRLRRKQQGILREDDKAFRESEEMEAQIEQMSPEQRSLFDKYSRRMPEKKALRRVVDESQTATEINALRQRGLTDIQIFGDEDVGIEGLVGEDGRVDADKLAKFMGAAERKEQELEALEAERADKQRRLDGLIEYQESFSDPMNEVTPERRKKVAGAIQKLQAELGLIPKEEGEAEFEGTMQDTSKIIRKDIHDADRYKPSN